MSPPQLFLPNYAYATSRSYAPSTQVSDYGGVAEAARIYPKRSVTTWYTALKTLLNHIAIVNEQRKKFAMPHLKLDQSLVNEARTLAQHIVEPVIGYISAHTTVAIERTTLRLIGVD